jgi:hypothetical protein|tara:strand:- start:276 stop:1226 length:951 start_codon:yes stop_codon:yes gene_type:complete
MPTNFYFDTGTTEEKRLYEDLVIEQLKVFGQDVYYMPRTLVAEDKVLGEDALSKFDDAYMIEMYFENTDGFAGDKEIMNQFGLENREEAVFIVSQRRFEDLIIPDENIGTRPEEGDLIYFPLVNKVFEISFVDHDEPFYQIGNLPVYRLSTKTFEYSSEDLDTGITEFDAIETAISADTLQFQLTLEQSGTYNEQVGLEQRGNQQFKLENGDGFAQLETSGIILTEYGEEDGSIVQDTAADVLDYIVHEDETMSGSIIMENEADTGIPQYIILESFREVGDGTVDKTAQNELYDTLDDTILDFSESNPFGDVGTKG